RSAIARFSSPNFRYSYVFMFFLCASGNLRSPLRALIRASAWFQWLGCDLGFCPSSSVIILKSPQVAFASHDDDAVGNGRTGLAVFPQVIFGIDQRRSRLGGNGSPGESRPFSIASRS